jgi:GT2 family glycosyltransferase
VETNFTPNQTIGKPNIMKPSVLILIVTYKCPLHESKTINSILEQGRHDPNCRYVIWDNSPVAATPLELEKVREGLSFEYISRPENVALSKVYNQVVSANKFEYILLLDQDTGIPKNYLREIGYHIANHPHVNLFLPIVKNNQLIVSPGNFNLFKGKHWKDTRKGLIPSKNILAVTSGMLISRRYIDSYSYQFDERLNLYGIDSKFMLDFAKNEKELFVLPLTLAHSSALWSNPTSSELLPRFKNLRKAWDIILSDRPLPKLLNAIYGKYLCIKLAVKYRDIRFMLTEKQS